MALEAKCTLKGNRATSNNVVTHTLRAVASSARCELLPQGQCHNQLSIEPHAALCSRLACSSASLYPSLRRCSLHFTFSGRRFSIVSLSKKAKFTALFQHPPSYPHPIARTTLNEPGQKLNHLLTSESTSLLLLASFDLSVLCNWQLSKSKRRSLVCNLTFNFKRQRPRRPPHFLSDRIVHDTHGVGWQILDR